MQLEFHQLDRGGEHLRVQHPQQQKQLLASLATSGQQTPIVVVAVTDQPKRYRVIDGYKRIAALQQLRRDTVEAVVWAMNEAEALVLDRSLRWSRMESPLLTRLAPGESKDLRPCVPGGVRPGLGSGVRMPTPPHFPRRVLKLLKIEDVQEAPSRWTKPFVVATGPGGPEYYRPSDFVISRGTREVVYSLGWAAPVAPPAHSYFMGTQPINRELTFTLVRQMGATQAYLLCGAQVHG